MKKLADAIPMKLQTESEQEADVEYVIKEADSREARRFRRKKGNST